MNNDFNEDLLQDIRIMSEQGYIYVDGEFIHIDELKEK